jgi:UDP-glucose:(heptosyl)LPS alpha-1,3-glucosyltransferase
MKIAILGRTFCRQAGGAETYAVEVAREMSATHDVHVFTQRTDRSIDGVTYHLIWRLSERPRWVNHLLFAWQTWRATRTGFDAVMSHELTWHGQIQIIHVRPVRYNLFHNINGWKKIFRGLKVLTSPRLMCYVLLESARFRAPHVVATSEFLAKECQTAYPKTQVTVIEPGVRMPDERIDKNEAQFKNATSFEARPQILFVANDFKRKGLDTILQVLATIQNKGHSAGVVPQLIVVGGDQKSIDAYKTKTSDLNLTGLVKFAGTQQHMTPYYRMADLLLHPTQEDSFGMVVLEALTYGLNVCVSGPSYCGISSKISHLDGVSIISNPLDTSGVMSVLERAMQDLKKNQKPSAARMAFIESCQWEGIGFKYEKILKSISDKNLNTIC